MDHPTPKAELIADYVACPFPAHGEEWARNALARGRLRGETLHMWHCPLADHWHVTFKSVEELLQPPDDADRRAI